jgi:hypothetical protein
MTRSASGSWLTILLLALFTVGIAVEPCQAANINWATSEATPIVTNATLSNVEPNSSKAAFQASYISLSLKTDKSVYLTDETIAITVNTSAANTHVRLLAQLPDGSQATIGEFNTSGSYTQSWSTSMPGQVRITCEGTATVLVWTTCIRSICVGGDCWFDTYPCQQPTQVTGSASSDIRVYSRETSISGYVSDSSNQPIAGGLVRLTNDTSVYTTDSSGYYKLDYTIGDNYQLGNNQIPTATETISFEAIACEPNSLKVDVPAERGVSNANITLQRLFYPPAIDLSKFTFDNFSNWSEAKNLETWRNMLGIAIESPTELKSLKFESKELQAKNDYKTFRIDNQTLYLITDPKTGRYHLIIEGKQSSQYNVAASATLDSNYIEEVTLSDGIEAGKSQRLRLSLQADSLELVRSEGFSFPLALVIIPIAIFIVGGLAAAYFLTGGKLGNLKRAFAGAKVTKSERATEERKPLEAATPKAARKVKRKTKPKAKVRVRTKPEVRAERKLKTRTETKARRKVEAKTKGEAQKITKAKSTTVAKTKAETQLKTKRLTTKKVA